MGKTLADTNRILMYGLEKSGKSTLISSFQEGHFTTGTPFTAHNITEITINGKWKFDIIEVGGRKEVRRFVSDYMSYVHAIIFVIDGSDAASFPEVKIEFEKLVDHPDSLGKPLAVLFNKKDIAQVHPSVIISELDILNDYTRPHRVFSSTAKKPDDFKQILLWIKDRLKEDSIPIQDKASRLITICILDMLEEQGGELPLLSLLGQLEIISRSGQVEFDRDKILFLLRKLSEIKEVEFVNHSKGWRITEKGRRKLKTSELIKGGRYEKIRAIIDDDSKGIPQDKEEREKLDEFDLDELADLYNKTKKKN